MRYKISSKKPSIILKSMKKSVFKFKACIRVWLQPHMHICTYVNRAISAEISHCTSHLLEVVCNLPLLRYICCLKMTATAVGIREIIRDDLVLLL
jgi:hypothetical protein